MKIKSNSTHVIVYTGAPYGDGEGGHVVSQHQSQELAEKAYARKFDGTTGVLTNSIVALDEPYGGFETAREYFA